MRVTLSPLTIFPPTMRRRNRTILARIPAGRLGSPAAIGETAVFLASGLSDYVSGHT
jgi:NAD(P)-dependent dehydrogenase (short-subunit alcohol dehydrogenase family)